MKILKNQSLKKYTTFRIGGKADFFVETKNTQELIDSIQFAKNQKIKFAVIGNGSNTGVFYADKGIIEPGNNNNFKEITAWEIEITNDSVIDYETGLASILFSSCSTCPGGTYSLVKGTYQVK